MAELAVYDNDPTLYLFTSLTAGSSHIVTATSRIETILKANKIPFKGVDTATDELARKLYGRRARGKKLPLLVKEGFVIADLEQVEEWNEYDELKEALGAPAVPAKPAAPMTANSSTPTPATATAKNEKENTPSQTPSQTLAIRQLGAEAASIAASKKSIPANISTTNPLLASKASPSTSTPLKSPPPAGILSPRSIPLPATPAGKPESPTTEFHGRKVESPGDEEIKEMEQALSIAEVSSGEEEDSEDEKEKGRGEVGAAKTEDVGKEEVVEGKSSAEEEDENEEEETQKQDVKAADKAGVSVED